MNLPKYLNPDSPQKKGRKQEKKACQTINSGTLWFDKGDLKVNETDEKYLVDVKTVVTQKSFKINLEDVEKLHKQAGLKTPVLLIYIGDYIIKSFIQRKGIY